MSGNEDSWRHKAEYYERRYHEVVKLLLRVIRIISKENLESGWDDKGEDVQG